MVVMLENSAKTCGDWEEDYDTGAKFCMIQSDKLETDAESILNS